MISLIVIQIVEMVGLCGQIQKKKKDHVTVLCNNNNKGENEMKDINDYTIEELEKIIEDKKRNKAKRPKLNYNPDYAQLISLCIEIMDKIDAGIDDKNNISYVYETAMETLYGEDVWEWIDSKLSN
jgi:hypothetical protein